MADTKAVISSENPKIIITNSGVGITEIDLARCFPEYKAILDKCTLNHISVFGKNRTVTTMRCYKNIEIGTTSWYIFARYSPLINTLKNVGCDPIIINRISTGKDIHPELLYPGIEPYDNQAIAVNYIMEKHYTPARVASGTATCLLVMDTGIGKTYVAGVFIGKLAKRTLVIIPKKSALNEWSKMLQVAYPEIKVGYYMSNRKENLDADVMITTSASANKGEWMGIPTAKLFKSYGFVIYDEVHNYATESRSNMFWKLNACYVLGITATPDEHAKQMDEYYYRHIGRPLIAKDLPGFFTESVNWNITVEAIEYQGPAEFTKSIKIPGQDTLNFSMTIQQLLKDPYRLSLILDIVKKLYDSGKFIYIFAEQRKMLSDFASLVSSSLQIGVEAPEIGIFLGGIDESVKAEKSKSARIILITYGYGAESLSIVKMDTLVFLTPRKAKMMQVVGRILRRSQDNTKPRTIVDVVDVGISISRQFQARKAVYTEKNCIINKKFVNYKDINLYANL